MRDKADDTAVTAADTTKGLLNTNGLNQSDDFSFLYSNTAKENPPVSSQIYF